MFPFILFIVSLLSIVNTQTYAQPLYQTCGEQGNYTANSTYQTNLNLLLQYLPSNTSRTGFGNSTIGTAPNRVYGSALCRGDVSRDACNTCVETATEEIIQLCPLRKVAYIWYDNCFLRYSNTSFFSIMAISPEIYMWNTQNVTNQSQFNQLLSSMLSNISTDAAVRSPNLFAVGEANFTGFPRLYGLTQCTRDISRDDCRRCLQSLISQIPRLPLSGAQGGRILGPSCNFRYETYSFYNATAIAPPSPLSSPPPQAPPPSPLPSPPSSARNSPSPPSIIPTGEGNDGRNAPIIVVVVVSTVIAITLFG